MKTDAILFEGLDLEDLYRHLVVFGSTGSGKTWHLILPLLQQILACNADVPEKRAGCIVFDVKGDMRRHLSAVMKAAGRKDEIITIGAGGNCWFDPFGGMAQDSRGISERLMEIIRGIHDGGTGGAYDGFWVENLRRFLAGIGCNCESPWTWGLGRCGRNSLMAVSSLCSVRRLVEEEVDTGELMSWLKTAERGEVVPAAEIEMARFYLETEAKNLAWNTWTVICNYAQSYVSCLRDSPLASILLTPSASHQFVPEDIIDHGRVVIVCLTRIQFGNGAEVYRNLIKTAFQTCALQRHSRRHFDGKAVRPINATRPVLFVADEFRLLLTVGSVDDGDAFFLDKCRETKIGCIVSAQGISALLARTGSSARAYHLPQQLLLQSLHGHGLSGNTPIFRGFSARGARS